MTEDDERDLARRVAFYASLGLRVIAERPAEAGAPHVNLVNVAWLIDYLTGLAEEREVPDPLAARQEAYGRLVWLDEQIGSDVELKAAGGTVAFAPDASGDA